jgi:DNA-binding response OmpR family regulator
LFLLAFLVKNAFSVDGLSLLPNNKPAATATAITIGKYTFDSENFLLTSANFQKTLTKKEAQILKILIRYKNQVTPRDIILNAVWGQDDYFVGRSMDVFITKIRKCLIL